MPLVWSLVIALSARLLVSLALPGPLRPDEIYQYLEPAYRLVTGYGVMTWDWHEGIRSWLVPGGIAGLLRISHTLGLGFSIAFVRTIFAILSLPLVILFVQAGWRQAGRQGAWLFGLAGALWPDLVSAGFRTLGECLGGNMLAAGTIAGMIALDRQRKGESRRATFLLLLLCGFSLGSAAAVRFQFAPAVLFGCAFLFLKGGWRTLLPVSISLVPPIAALGIVDALTLGYPFQSVFHNYHMNASMGVANTFGRQSILYFPAKYSGLWGAAAIAILLLCIRGAKYASFPLSMALVIVGYHSCIAHKEMSFIYPAIPLFILTAAAGLAHVVTTEETTRRWFPKAAMLEAACCGLVFASTYLPLLTQKSIPLLMEKRAVAQPDFCGLALADPPEDWAHFGGYSILPPGRPFYVFTTPAQMEQNRGAYSHVLAGSDFDLVHMDARKISCSRDDSICLYQVATSCDKTPDFNQFSEAAAQIEQYRLTPGHGS